MKIILKQDVKSLGKVGDTIKVSDGYGRNFLIPRGLAVEQTSKTMQTLEREKKHILQKAEKEKNQAELLVETMRNVMCVIPCRVGEQDKLFGSVTTKDIEKSLLAQGIAIDRKMIVLEEPIKSLGEYNVKVRLLHGISSEIKVNVVAEKKE